MAKAYAIGVVSLEEIMRIRDSPTKRLTTSPIGVDVDLYAQGKGPKYLSRAVFWKQPGGQKFLNLKAFTDYIMENEGKFKTPSGARNLIAGIEQAQAIVRQVKGVTGTLIVNNKLYTNAQAKMKALSKKHKPFK